MRLIIGSLVGLNLLFLGCVSQSPGGAINAKVVQISDGYIPYGIHSIEYEGNKYILVRETECVAITPALPARADKVSVAPESPLDNPNNPLFNGGVRPTK
jgi:hypothetical protein